jgi:transforming growth factor-beta-induced protein
MKRLTIGLVAAFFALGINAFSQTNVFDDIIVPSPDHTYLEAAILQEGLEGALQAAPALTIFAPTDAAFTQLATALGTDINGLLALPNLQDILLYHVIGSSVPASAVNNGDIVTALSATNTIKMTKTSMGSVYANHAMVNAADLMADNGYVHSVDAIILPNETVVDIAIDNGFTSLTAAVITAELLPSLTNPLATLTVFAPTNQAFDDLASAFGTDINGLLALPNLQDLLLYHVLGSSVASTAVNNGDVVSALSPTNTIKLTKTAIGAVYANQAMVSTADLMATNGYVHVINGVILPVETVVDVAIDNGFTSLTAAVVTAELLPSLTNPLTQLTVFAPTNQAFDNLATALGTDINGLLANPELADILLYHVVSGTVLSTDLANGPVPTLNGQTVNVDLTTGVLINSSNVTIADLTVFNGVVHVIDAVLVPSLASLNELNEGSILIYPNPTSDQITIQLEQAFVNEFQISDINGRILKSQSMDKQLTIATDISTLPKGEYYLTLFGEGESKTVKFSKI